MAYSVYTAINNRSYDELSKEDKIRYNTIRLAWPELTEEQVWKDLEREMRSMDEAVAQNLARKASSEPKGRTKTKDALMKTVIYGGGFVVKSALSVIASVFGIHPGAVASGRSTAKEIQDKAWRTYCKEGDMEAGLKILFGN